MKKTVLLVHLALMFCMFLAAVGQAIPTWAPNTPFATGALVLFNNAEFRCIQAHTSQVGWEPPNVPALWQLVSGTPSPTPTPPPSPTPTPKPSPTPTPSPSPTPSGVANWAPGVSFSAGALVLFNGAEFKCIQAHTSQIGWEPPNTPALWQLVSGAPGPTPSPTPNTSPTPTPTPLPPGTRLFAPYIDMSLANHDLAATAQASGIKNFTLAFIIDNGGCGAGWGGLGVILPNDSYPDGSTVSGLVSSLRTAGGNVIVSFGGANGLELGQTCTSAAAAQAQYQAVINKYHPLRLDFDIEGAPIADTAAVDRRNQALAALQAANPGLQISYTLPVLPTGLTSDGVNVLSNALSHHVSVSLVNVMAMDYGSSTIADPNKMGQNAINAANATLAQMKSIGMTAPLGVTLLIGVNDVQPEITTLADTQQVVNFAQPNNSIGMLSMWSAGRDQACPGGATGGTISPTCSGVAQAPFDFAHALETFK